MHPTKIKEVKTTLGYKKELMRQSIGITNLQKIFVACFGHEICLKALLTAAIYMQVFSKNDYPYKFVYFYNYLRLCFCSLKSC